MPEPYRESNPAADAIAADQHTILVYVSGDSIPRLSCSCGLEFGDPLLYAQGIFDHGWDIGYEAGYNSGANDTL